MNKWGKNIKLEIFGTSHGKEIGITIYNLPKNFALNMDAIRDDMNRRRPGYTIISTPRKEADEFEILSGVEKNILNGEPLKMVIQNTNIKSSDYNSILRPGHADWTAFLKYGEVLPGGGQFSGRLTAPIVFAGAIAKQILNKKFNIIITSKILSVGTQKNPTNEELEKIVLKTQEKSDSIGGVIQVRATNIPKALGSDFFGGIEALLSTLFFSIPAVKGVEFGDGFKLSESYGSMTNDAIYADENKNIFSKTNHMGGILGGISNGMDIVTNIAIKPTPSISIEQDSINYKTFQPVKTKVTGRHDPCIVPRALVVGEAMMAIGLLELTEEKNE